MKSVLCATSSLLALLCSGAAASAQTSPTDAAPSTASSPAASPPPGQLASAAGDATREGVQLQEIVVTASRRAEDLQKSSIDVQAIGGQTLTRQGIVDVQDLTSLVAGLNVAPAGAYTQVFLRGIGDFSATPTAEGAIAVNLDQVYLSSPAAEAGVFYDLQRVEVLKGPQGTLYGRNASGGALNIITNKPTLDAYHADLTGEFGNFGLKKGEGALNLPLSQTLALRAAFQVVDRDGYYSDGYGDDKHQSGRVEVLYKPSSKLSVLITGDYTHLGGMGAGSVLTPFVEPSDPYLGNSSPQENAILLAKGPHAGPRAIELPLLANGFQDVKLGGVSADIDLNIGPATLSLIPAYRDSATTFLTYNGGFPTYDIVNEPQTSVEARVTSNGNTRLKYAGGVYYFDSIHNQRYGAEYSPLASETYDTTKQTDTTYAAFGQATYSLTSQLRVIGGLRYTYENKTQAGLQATLPARGIGCRAGQTAVTDPPPFSQLAKVWASSLCEIPVPGAVTFHELNYKAGLEYDLTARSMLYFSASSGFKAGGLYPSGPPNSFQPEKLDAYEFGAKNRFFDNRLQVNFEGFYWKYNNQQQSHVGPITPAPLFGFITVNAGAADLYGGEVSVQYLLTGDDVLSLDMEGLHTRYATFAFDQLDVQGPLNPASTGCSIGAVRTNATGNPVQSLNCSGKPLIRSPDLSGTVGYQHTFRLPNDSRVIFGVKTQFSTGYYTAIDYIRSSEYQNGYTNTSLDLTYEAPGGHYMLTGYVKNLENTAVVNGAIEQPLVPTLVYSNLQPPRTYGVRVAAHF